jgi:2-iminobutanoate/2-iminopropanoate deaminase
MRTIVTAAVPKPNGHYSPGIIVSTPLIFTSVQLPIAPTPDETPGEKMEDIAEQARQVMRNIDAIVVAGGSSLSRLVRIMFYVTKISYWPVVD